MNNAAANGMWRLRLLPVVGLAVLLAILTAGCSGSADARPSSPTAMPTVSSGTDSGTAGQVGGGGSVPDIGKLVLDILQGKSGADVDAIVQSSEKSATSIVGTAGPSDLFFLDFGNPNLRLNQFAATLARNLLALTPLYVIGYLLILVYDVWRERPVPNPILYGILVIAVMIFLAAFGVITQGLGELGRALAAALGGSSDAMFARATLEDTIVRVLANLRQASDILAIVVLLVSILEVVIILIQLAYRGLSMAIWRLLGVLLIPVSVLLEGVTPKTAGRVLSGFFESWLDMVGKITLLLIVLAIASSSAFAGVAWLILPAGLLVVILSWKFLGVVYVMVRDAVSRAWSGMMPTVATESAVPLPAAAEAARAREIDHERKRLMEE